MTSSTGISFLISRAEHEPETLSADDWGVLLSADEPPLRQALAAAALRVKRAEVGPVVRVRGLVEFSNECVKNCRYCGIRRDNRQVTRYRLDTDAVVAGALAAHAAGYGSLVLQAGERRDDAFTDFVARTLETVHAATGHTLGVTLSLGEQSAATYRRWRDAGAHRYLLRVETTNPRLYASLHPADHDRDERIACLARLRDTGYQVGTGVMIGLPGQSPRDLARDLLFFREQDVDMVGMGPFIPHDNTPLACAADGFDPARQLDLGLAMIACARLLLRDVNIASTTALEALAPDGRALGLLAGANVVMPNHTAADHRPDYQLYRGKPALDESGERNREKLEALAASIGETVGFGERGDAPHYTRRRTRTGT